VPDSSARRRVSPARVPWKTERTAIGDENKEETAEKSGSIENTTSQGNRAAEGEKTGTEMD